MAVHLDNDELVFTGLDEIGTRVKSSEMRRPDRRSTVRHMSIDCEHIPENLSPPPPLAPAAYTRTR